MSPRRIATLVALVGACASLGACATGQTLPVDGSQDPSGGGGVGGSGGGAGGAAGSGGEAGSTDAHAHDDAHDASGDDASLDAAADVSSDASLDAALDALRDVTLDATSEVGDDVSSDVETDASNDVDLDATGATDASDTGAADVVSDAALVDSASDASGGCGDRIVDPGEQCDDGNRTPNDGCSATCQWETNCQNDNPHRAIACSGTFSGSFSGTYDDIRNLCGKAYIYQDLIFVFTATANQNVTVDFAVSTNDVAIFVMKGSCHSSLCFVDSTLGANRKSTTFAAEAGYTYYIDLEAPSNQPSFKIDVSCN